MRRRLVALIAALVVAAGATPAVAATKWSVAAPTPRGRAGALAVPAAPASVSATCSLVALKITVSWPAVTLATSYTVYQSSGGAYSAVATVTGTSWTSPVLLVGSYTFKVSATVGTYWAGPLSTASASHTITVLVCT